MNYIVPIIIILTLLYAICKKVNCYNSFVLGAKNSMPTIVAILPYMMAMFVMVSLLRASGLGTLLSQWLAVPFGWLGIPTELAELVLLRPFSGSGSTALLTEIYTQYGTDSYIARCASVIMGSSETVFYVSALYFGATKVKKVGAALPIALFCTLVGCIVACLLCRVM